MPEAADIVPTDKQINLKLTCMGIIDMLIDHCIWFSAHFALNANVKTV